MSIKFSEDMEVQTIDGKKVGMIDRIVVDPISNNVTHVIVRKGLFFTEDRIIPMEAFIMAEDDEIRLVASVKELEDFPLYEENHFVISRGYTGTPYLDWSMSPLFFYPPIPEPAPTTDQVVNTDQNLPPSSAVIDEGTPVISLDDEDIGNVEQVITDDHGEITHIVISKGLIFQTERLVPVGWVRKISDNKIRLYVRKETVEHLPEYDD